jgi:hypothetical protein
MPSGRFAAFAVGRAAHHRDQQRDFVELQLRERLAEVELTRKPETVDRALSVLAEIDFVDVGIHQVLLLEMDLEQHGHHRFFELAPERPPVVEEIALHELLRERRAALLDLPCAQVHPGRAQNCADIDAEMRIELAVLDDLQCSGQEPGDFLRRHHDAVFAMDREDAADEQRIQAEDRHILAALVAQALDRVAARLHADAFGLLQRVPELEASVHEVDAIAATAVAARVPGGIDAPVTQALQLLLERVGAEREPGIQLERLGIDLRRQRPATAFELLGHFAVEVQDPAEECDQQDAERQRQPRVNLFLELFELRHRSGRDQGRPRFRSLH